jgi:integrase
VNLPYLNIFRARGQMVAYYRRDGVSHRLRDEAGASVDVKNPVSLAAAWQRAHETHEAATRAATAAGEARAIRPQSIADLIARYRASPEWAEKKPETKRDYEKALGPLERDWGHLPVTGLRRKHVGAVRDKYAWRMEANPDRPGQTTKVSNARQANRVITVLSILLSYAVDPLGWREDNPALRPRRLRTDGEGYRPWTQAEFTQFWKASADDWRFAALLALLTGQRGQDLVAMQWADYDGAKIYVVQEKGRRQVKIWVPCHPVLKEWLDRRRAVQSDRRLASLSILTRPDGKSWIIDPKKGEAGVNAFQKAASKAIRTAGLSGVVWHGLRGATASWAAEGGATDQQIAALLGHQRVETTRRYSRGAKQQQLASGATAAIVLPFDVKSDTKRPSA